MQDIKHRNTKAQHPWTNGYVERMNRTLLDECFRVQGRKNWYVEPAEIQRDLDGHAGRARRVPRLRESGLKHYQPNDR